uniref:Uncharacterized protein n=1 Tax=Trypanosoma congolense (strain IL3000) TaxID=1068625 RepID=G0V070_TRYCI|nr:conserved hypothetical protein [Trypanosoma congolense IL3000]
MLSMLIVSPFHRCIETAIIINITGFDGRLALFVDPLLSDWYSSKIYSYCPQLGGRYDFDGTRVVFRPHWESVRASLTSFFRSVRVPSTLARKCGISGEPVAARWILALERLYDQGRGIPLWTSPSLHKVLHKALAYRNFLVTDSHCRRAGSGAAASDDIGGVIGYPEGQGSLVCRAAETIQAHFRNTVEGASVVPQCIWEAAQREARLLPRSLEGRFPLIETPTADLASLPRRGRALLPPTRVMMVTHADVVSALLNHCCPMHRATAQGFSVPYCSITCLSRPNDFYSGDNGDNVARDNSGFAGGGPTGKGSRFHVSGSEPWSVDLVGSTSHLHSAVVLQFS